MKKPAQLLQVILFGKNRLGEMMTVKKMFLLSLLFAILPSVSAQTVLDSVLVDSVVVDSPCILGCIYHSSYSTCYHSFGLYFPDSIELIDDDHLYSPFIDTFLLGTYPAGTHFIFYMNTIPGIGPCDHFTRLDTSDEYCHIYQLGENHWELAWEDWLDHSFDDIVFEVFCVNVCAPASAIILCGPCGGFTGCEDQEVSFLIVDTTGIAIDTTRMWFTIEINHLSGNVDTIYISTPSDSIHFDFISSSGDTVFALLQNFNFLSGDSIVISLDSVYNINNCLTTFH